MPRQTFDPNFFYTGEGEYVLTKRDIKAFEIRLRVDNSDRRLAVGMTAYVDFPLP